MNELEHRLAGTHRLRRSSKVRFDLRMQRALNARRAKCNDGIPLVCGAPKCFDRFRSRCEYRIVPCRRLSARRRQHQWRGVEYPSTSAASQHL